MQFEEVFPPYEAAPDFAHGNLALYRLLDYIAPFRTVYSVRAFVCPDFLDGEHAQYACCTPEMVLVRVGYHERVEVLDSYVVQKWHDDVLAGIVPVLVARVDQNVAVPGCPEEYAVALPDIDDGHAPCGLEQSFVALEAEDARKEEQAENAEGPRDEVLAV